MEVKYERRNEIKKRMRKKYLGERENMRMRERESRGKPLA